MVIHLVPSVVNIVLLFTMGILDIKRRMIPVWLISLYIALGLISGFFYYSFINVVLSTIPGLVMLFLAFVSSEKIGYADGLLSIGLGIWMGSEMSVMAIVFGVLGMGAYSTVLILVTFFKRKKINIQKQLPFIPFLWGGLVVSFCYVKMV